MCFGGKDARDDGAEAPKPAAPPPPPQFSVTSPDGVSRVKSTGRRTAEATQRLKDSKFGDDQPPIPGGSPSPRRSGEGYAASGARHSGGGQGGPNGGGGGMYGPLYGPVSGNVYHHVNGGLGGAPSGGMYASAMAGHNTAHFGDGVNGMAGGGHGGD